MPPKLRYRAKNGVTALVDCDGSREVGGNQSSDKDNMSDEHETSGSESGEDTESDDGGHCPCTKCENEVEEGLQCEWCDSWTHFDCAKMRGHKYESLIANQNVLFVCVECLEFYDVVKVGIRAIRKAHGSSKKSNTGINTSIINEAVSLMCTVANANDVSEVKKVLKHNDCSSYADALKKDMTDMKNDIAELKRCMNQKVSAVGDAILEGKEKERRETNIILHQVPESSNEADAKEHDVQKVKDVLNGIGLCNIELLRVFRLGPKRPDGKSRLLLADVGSKDKRDNILRRAPNLRKVESLSRVFICEDRTPAEQEAMRKLVKEKNEKSSQDPEHVYVIRNFRIVCLQRQSSTAAMDMLGGASVATTN